MKINYTKLDRAVSALNRLPDNYTPNEERPEMWDGEYRFLSYLELEKLTALNLL